MVVWERKVLHSYYYSCLIYFTHPIFPREKDPRDLCSRLTKPRRGVRRRNTTTRNTSKMVCLHCRPAQCMNNTLAATRPRPCHTRSLPEQTHHPPPRTLLFFFLLSSSGSAVTLHIHHPHTLSTAVPKSTHRHSQLPRPQLVTLPSMFITS